MNKSVLDKLYSINSTGFTTPNYISYYFSPVENSTRLQRLKAFCTLNNLKYNYNSEMRKLEINLKNEQR